MTLQPHKGRSGVSLATVPATLATRREAGELAAAWLVSYDGATREAYARDLACWGRFLPGVGVLDPLLAARGHVDAYAQWLAQEGRARSTVARRLAALSSFYRYCVDEGALERSPVRGRRPRVGQESQTLGLDRDELRDVLAAAKRSGPRDYALACVLAFNGLRVSEALNTDVGDLGTERGHRTLTITRKGGTRALVPLAPRAGEALDAWISGRDVGPIFATRSGARMDRHAARKIVVRLGREAGIGKALHPHMLRHTFVTLALDAGVSLRDVQDAAGHADPRTTRRYDRARHSLDRHPTYAVASSVG